MNFERTNFTRPCIYPIAYSGLVVGLAEEVLLAFVEGLQGTSPTFSRLDDINTFHLIPKSSGLMSVKSMTINVLKARKYTTWTVEREARFI